MEVWSQGAHLYAVEVAHRANPVHQQGDPNAAVLLRRAGRSRCPLEVLIGSQQRQPLFGSQGSLQKANFLPQLIFIQNYLHLKIQPDQLFFLAL